MAVNTVKFKMHSPYRHLIDYWASDGEKCIECFNDGYVTQVQNPQNSIALLIEPRPLQPSVYEFVENNYNKFRYVFTHDSILLNKLPNAKPIIWGGVWGWGDGIKDFSHPISMVASWKEEAPTRIERKKLAFEMTTKIDTYGTFNGGEKVSTNVIYGKYPYSIVIENHIDDIWITEKICNCFANYTVPIYYGARKIGDYFNTDGIIICHNISEVRRAVDYLLFNAIQDYYLRYEGVIDNFKRVYQYKNFDYWFMNNYGELLGEMI